MEGGTCGFLRNSWGIPVGIDVREEGRGVDERLGGHLKEKKGSKLCGFLGSLGPSWLVNCCIPIVSIFIIIFMTIISILTSLHSLHLMIYVPQLLDLPAPNLILFSPYPSIFTCTCARMPSMADNRSYSSESPSRSMVQGQCPAPSEASPSCLPNFLHLSSR